MKRTLLGLLLLATLTNTALAYTIVTASTSAPQGTEQSFIALTTTSFNASLFVNPLFPGTYQILLLGGVKSTQEVLIDSGTYAFVWGQGMQTERQQDIANMVGPDLNCDASSYCVNGSSLTSTSNYQTYGSTYSVVVDPLSCKAIVCRIAADLYLQNFPGP